MLPSRTSPRGRSSQKIDDDARDVDCEDDRDQDDDHGHCVMVAIIVYYRSIISMISDDHRSRNCRKSMQGRFLMTFEYVVNVDVGMSYYVQTGHSEKPPQAQAGLVKFNTRCSTENCGSNGSGSKYDDSSNPKASRMI